MNITSIPPNTFELTYSTINSDSLPTSSSLNPEDKALHAKIVRRLLQIHSERYVHKDSRLAPPSFQDAQVSALIFRQSESWTTVQKKFNDIKDSEVPQEVIDWVETWTSRINSMREAQHKVQNYIEKITLEKANLTSANNERNIKSSIALTEKITAIRDRIHHLETEFNKEQSSIQSKLAEGKANIDLLNQDNVQETHQQKIKQNENCKTIISYINKYWLHLNVFSEVPEISLDEKTIATQVRHLKKPADQLALIERSVNLSTKYIFIIKEIDSYRSPLKYSIDDQLMPEPGEIYRPKKVNIFRSICYTQSLSDETKSPRDRKQSSRKGISDVILFSSANQEDTPNQRKQSSRKNIRDDFQYSSVGTNDETLDKIQEIVSLALVDVNNELKRARTPNTPPHPINMFFFRFFNW